MSINDEMDNYFEMRNNPKKFKEFLMNETIKKAKEKVGYNYSFGGCYDREWLEGVPPFSYDDPEYKVSLLVLSGSPPKGYVLADYESGIVVAFGLRLRRLYTYKAYEKLYRS